MKAYKVFNSDWTCRNFQYQIGERYVMNDLPIIGEIGFHACKKLIDCFYYYEFDNENKVAIVEIFGDIDSDGEDSKISTNDIKIIKELTWYEVLDLVNLGKSNTGNRNTGNRNTGNRNTGDSNTGYRNTGNRNTGNSNTGDRNTGDSNTGNSNTGYRNTGDSNTGNRNTGNRNTGDSNTGYRNTGYRNTGNSNTGDRNTGSRNTGYRNTGNSNTGDRNTGDSNTGYSNTGDRNTGNSNTGNRNTGNRNTGDWNTGNYNCGDFNTKDPEKVYFFNKLIDKKEVDEIRQSGAYRILNRFRLIKYKIRKTTGKFGDYRYLSFKSSFKYFWRNLTVKERQEIKNMPYFDEAIFFEITGANHLARNM